ncbi:MAG: hypothetical protein ACR2GF_00565 [Acidimicrobiales bacterium]
MTLFSRFLALALLATLVVCSAVVLTGGHPQTALTDIGSLYHRVAR